MGNPNPNAFVSAYKHYLIKKAPHGNTEWDVTDKQTKKIVGTIKLIDKQWLFYPKVTVFTHLQLLDVAAAVKTIEKRNDTPSIYA